MMMERVLFNVKGMSCEGCSKGIVAALKFIPGVVHAQSSYAEGTVLVQYDAARVEPKTLRDEIAALEYELVD